MYIQKSYHDESEGALYLVPTPIGNLEDMTFRAIRTLQESDYIAAEDTRVTKKLCNHFEINRPLISYHEHSKKSIDFKILDDIESGKKVALVSDAGMPCISDPGMELVKEAIHRGLKVISLPGANAALTALVASGLPTYHFYFYGFLSRDKKERRKELQSLHSIKDPILFYESPHRLTAMLEAIHEQLGKRHVIVCRELTKRFEEYVRGSAQEVISYFNEHGVKGECCVIVEGSSEDVVQEQFWHALTITQHVQYYIDEKQESVKEAIKRVAKDRELPKREVYQEFHEL